jgi:hypothetical protein
MALAKISPLRVKDIDEAQRAIDQLTERVNELTDLSNTNETSSATNTEQLEGEEISPTTFTIMQTVTIKHSLGRPFIGFQPYHGLKVEVLDDSLQTDPNREIKLRVLPWYPVDDADSLIKLTGSVQSIDWTGLDGNKDLGYRIRGKIVNAQSPTSVRYEFYPNLAAPANAHSDRVGSGASSTHASMTFMLSGFLVSLVDIYYYPVDDHENLYTCTGMTFNPTTPAASVQDYGGGGNPNPGANLTSLRMRGGFGSSFAADTLFTIEKMVPTRTELEGKIF